MKKFSVKKKLKAFMAAALCVCMAASPLTAFAESLPEQEESILSDNFDELVRKAEEENKEHEAEQIALNSADEGLVVKTYASGNYDFNVDLTVGKTINYNGYQTHQYSLSDGTVVYCLEPSKANPSNGQYTASVSNDALLSAVAYYGYGGPGYESDKGMYNMLQENVRPYAYVITHMALSWVYDGCSDDSDAFKGNAATADGIKNIVNLINAYSWTVPSGFAAFTFGTSGQTMGFGYFYNPVGSVNLKKTSANPAISDGNSCYSLKDAVYGVYGDSGCTDQRATLTTDESGNSNSVDLSPGTYWVKEISAPKGFALDTIAHQITINGGQNTTVELQDMPQADPVTIVLGKVDKDTNANKPQGSASLAGAEFTVKYYDGLHDTDPAEQGLTAVRTWVLQTDEDGYCDLSKEYKVAGDEFYYNGTKNPAIPIGTITIQETKAPEGYLIDTTVFVQKITVDNDGERLTTYNQPVIKEQVIRGGVKIQKRDYENGSTPQGNGNFANAEISIINNGANAVYVNGNTYEPGQTVLTMVTDSTGLAQTAADALPHGDYMWKETKAPAGYQISGVTEGTFVIRENGVIVDLSAADKGVNDKVIRGGVKIQKRDYETEDTTPMGSATLAGAEVNIVTTNDNPVIVNGVTYTKGQVVTKLTTDENGCAQTTADLLPSGTYSAVEIKAPQGYLLAGVIIQNFTISKNGEIVDLSAKDTSFKDKVKRGDFELRKIDSETQESMDGVSFDITNVTTGEKHRFTTDENGYYSSKNDWNPHSQNTNGGGAEDGLWFGQTTGGAMAAVDDSLGALPYGVYLIDEVEGINNAGKEMFHGYLYIRRNNVTINMGNIENYGDAPEITVNTKVKDPATDTQYSKAQKDLTVVDEVSLDGLIPGREYTIEGTLMDKETRKPILTADDKEVTAKTTFTATNVTQVIEMTYTLDASDLAGKSIVAFEKVYYRGKEVAAHESITDKDQTIYFPEISTSLTDDVTGEHMAEAAENMSLTDTVNYKGLRPGREYVLKGILMDKATGKELLINGEKVTQELRFTPDDTDGSVDMTFTFDGSALAGKTVVAFESCLYDGKEIAVHHDIDSEEQTVHIPEIETKLTNDKTGTHEALAEKEMSLTDTVPYHNLIPGKEYTVKGVLMDKATGKELLINGEKVTKEVTFTPEKADGSVELTFTFDGSALAGKTVVAFEDCYYDGKEIAVHHDIKSKDQTVDIPKIVTELVNDATGDHEAAASTEMSLTDKVSYYNLKAGKEYTMKGTLMDKTTGEPLLINGEQVTKEVIFTPEKADGSVEMTFTFDGSALAGKTVVAFEDCLRAGKEVAVHHDINSKEQTIDIPGLKTELKDDVTGSHNALAEKEMSLTDIATYTGLIPGKEYTMKGTLMDKTTGEPLLINGEKVTKEVTFTPEQPDGSVELTFTFDGSALAGKSVVAFEDCFRDGKEVAVHHDIDSKEQTVDIPDISTELKDDVTGSHAAEASGEMSLTDVVPYHNLIPGKEYTMKGVLMDKETGKELVINGNTVTQEVTFTPEKADGSVELTFKFDGTSLGGKTVVAFESCLYDGKEVAVHHDIDSKEQSVDITNPPVPEAPKPKTGDNSPVLPLTVALAASAAAIGVGAKKASRTKAAKEKTEDK
ncbi:MAG TPA: cell wall anchor protein [Roseburia sp.]|nr:cell wall anchor protein [Roseburia sp.]